MGRLSCSMKTWERHRDPSAILHDLNHEKNGKTSLQFARQQIRVREDDDGGFCESLGNR